MMKTKRKCACCGSTISGQLCFYCGFMNIAALDDEAADEIKKEAEKYKNDIVRKITDFNIVGYECGWIEKDSKFDLISKKIIKLADGSDCINSIFWSKVKFGQDIEGDNETKNIDISYKFGGNKKMIHCSLMPVLCDDFWQIGLEIAPELRLIVYLGNEKKFAKSKQIELNFS